METFSFIKGNDERQYEEYRMKRVILEKGTFGGYRPGKIYGRFDCQSANNAIAKSETAPQLEAKT